jgi:hypothetical protein
MAKAPGYINLGVRKAQDCNVVNVASFIALNAKDGSIEKRVSSWAR